MNVKEKIEELLEASEDGTITAAQVTKVGLHRSILQEFVKSGEMYRFGRGMYVRGTGFTRTIPLCICWAIQTVPR